MAADRKESEAGLRCVWGILSLVLCLFSALSLFSYDWRDVGLLSSPPNEPSANLIGPVGAWLSYGLFSLLGVGAYLVPAWLLAVGIVLVLKREGGVLLQTFWCTVLLLSLTGLTELYPSLWTDLCRRLNLEPDAGGVVARLVTRGILLPFLSDIGSSILLWGIAAVALVLFAEPKNISNLFRWLVAGIRSRVERYRTYREEHRDEHERIEHEQKELEKRRKRLERVLKDQQKESERQQPVTPEPQKETPAVEEKREASKKEKEKEREKEREKPRKEPPPSQEGAVKAPSGLTNYQLPPLDILESGKEIKDRNIKTDTSTTAKILVETLQEFGIEAQVTNIERGPVVTRYELLPAPGIRVERIAGLSNNLALSLKATSVRVQAPVPGKGVVGIEVPNSVANMVCLRDVLEGDMWKAGKARLPLALGKDVGGNDLIADLADMPHLLVAGATGAGKTVCMNSILAGLLMSRTPDDLRLMLVDPKIVEFSSYNHLPHLVVPVITDPKKVALGLRWAINEMEKRYKLFAKVGVRNIESFNHRVIARQEDLFAAETPEAGEEKKADSTPARVPYIVIVIDELADLMLEDQAGIENCIARLAQLSRAVGIHMILSTQRPSVNVITGTIKANFPARIAFQVAQKVDSRTILDTVGADKLLGRGDMLFLPPGSSKLVRAQGAMTTDMEIKTLTEFIRKQGEPDYELEIKEKIDAPPGELPMDEESDELISQATGIIRETRRASTSSLQRRLRIGYTRAARIMDILEERGIVGPPRGSDPREILIDLDGEIPDNPTGEETA